MGRLADPARIMETIEGLLGKAGGPMDGLRVLVTAGGTREPIDSVRYVGNRSSGRMGLALAAEAARRGAEVTLLAANVGLAAPAGVRVVEVQTAAELLAAAREAFADAHVLLMAAAVADFRPSEALDDKISKSGRDGLALELEPTEDVLAALAGARGPGQTLVGFAAEHGAGAVERGRAKLERKGLDAVVVNDISRTEIGFDAPDNEVTIVTADGERHVPLGSKEAVAGRDPGRRRGTEDRPGTGEYRGRRIMSAEGAYELFKKGSELLEKGDFMAASIPLERAAALEPDKSSIREALGRAYFRSARFDKAAREFAAVVERYPVNDYAHFCLGRSLANTGRTAEARRHAALAANMRPDRKDYQAFSRRLQAA